MKKTVLIIALAITGFANAQKGTILVMGSVGIESSKQTFGVDEDTQTTFNFSPKVGYQFHENWTVGIEASVAGSKDESTTIDNDGFLITNNTKTTAISVGPFVRYSRPISEIFSYYVDMGAGFVSGKLTEEVPALFGTQTFTQKGDGVYVGITPAIFINVKKNFGLNVSIGGLGFQTFNLSNNGGDNSNFYFNFGQTVNIGISKNF